jgi:hypothetical protein
MTPNCTGKLRYGSGGVTGWNQGREVRVVHARRVSLNPPQVRRPQHAHLARRPRQVRGPRDAVISIDCLVHQRIELAAGPAPSAYVFDHIHVAVRSPVLAGRRIGTVAMLGSDTSLVYQQSTDGLHISCLSSRGENTYAFRIGLDGPAQPDPIYR